MSILVRSTLLAAALAMSPAPAAALAAQEPLLLPAACETDLALAAAPAHLRAGATVYVLANNGFDQVQRGDNGFTCIVNRDHPYVLKPTCFDAEGTATIVPKILRFGQLLVGGTPLAEIRAEIARGFDEGTFISPRRPGVAYMLSGYNRPYNPRSNALGWFPPHLMFYAPDLTPADIGFSGQAWQANRQLPLIAYQGHHGYMVVITGDSPDPESARPPSCPRWLASDRPWEAS